MTIRRGYPTGPRRCPRSASRWVGGLLAAALALSAAACSNEAPDPKPLPKADSGTEDTPPEPATPTPTPTPTPGEEPAPFQTTPGEPEQFTFIRHFVDVFNQSRRTGDVQPLLALGKPACKSCHGFARKITEFHDAGGRREGDFRWKIVRITHLGDETYLVQKQLDLTSSIRRQERLPRQPGQGHMSTNITWSRRGTDGSWTRQTPSRAADHGRPRHPTTWVAV